MEKKEAKTSTSIDQRELWLNQTQMIPRKQPAPHGTWRFTPTKIWQTWCKSCHLEFCDRKKVITFDVIFSHKERWMYPIKGDWPNCKASQRETVRYYHAAKKCLTSRFSYFSLEYIHIPSDIKENHTIKTMRVTFL